MLFYLLIFFGVSEIFFLTNGGVFWLIATLAFSIFSFRKFVHLDLKKFWILFPPVLLIFLGLLLSNVFGLGFWPGQLFLLILAGLFYVILRFYANTEQFERASNALMIIIGGIISFLFFRANILQGFFGKEIFLFICLLFLFEADRSVALIFTKNNNQEKAIEETKPGFISSIISSLILVEFFWLLNLWPINIISLTGIWLGGFYLVREFVFLSHKRIFNWRFFWPQMVVVLILVFLLMVSANWKVI